MSSKYASKHPLKKKQHPTAIRFVRGAMEQVARTTCCTNCGRTSFESFLLSEKCSCGGSMQVISKNIKQQEQQ